MNNRVERELIRLREKLDEKYDFVMMKEMYDIGSLEELGSIIMHNDDIQKALKFWFDVRIRKLDPTHETRPKNVLSNMIVNEIYNDLGITLSHNMIAGIMCGIISKDDILQGYSINPLDSVFMFNNVELVELSECSPLKIFIAQPMSGVPDEEVEKIRVHVSELMIKKFGKNIEIVDQFHVPEEEMPIESLERPGIHLLGRSIQFLADVDLVVFVGDFLHAKGCCVELTVCKEYDIPFEVHNISDIDKLSAKTDKRDNSNDWLY